MGANPHNNYFSPRGGAETDTASLTSAGNSIPCHSEPVSASQKNKNLCEKINLQTINVIPHCQRQDITLELGQSLYVIPHLLRDLIDKIRSRNKSGMTEVSCHPEVPEARQHSGSLCNFTGHPEAIAEGSQKVDEMLKQVQNDKYVSGAHSKHLFTYSLINLLTSKKAAFTLAEVLITLAIIGIVAAMTIPTLVANYQTRAWSTSASVFERKLEEALRQMNTQQVLAGYKSTADFVNALGKYFKINKVCPNNDLMSCFEDKVYWGANEEEVDMTVIKNAKNFGQEDWDTETIGVQFANGTTGLIAYNPDCKEQPFSNQFTGTSCLAILYDTTGFKTPNTQQKDLRSINVLSLGGNKCVIDLGSVCFTAPFRGISVSAEECKQMADNGYGNNKENCIHDTDFFAGAVKTCGGIDKMANAEQLTLLANEIYGTSVKSNDCTDNLAWDINKVEEMGFTPTDDGFYSQFIIFQGNDSSTSQFTPYRSYRVATTCNGKSSSREADSIYALCIAD